MREDTRRDFPSPLDLIRRRLSLTDAGGTTRGGIASKQMPVTTLQRLTVRVYKHLRPVPYNSD